jgi:coenzyme F420 biosynthesis associated uncharacterized protein
VQHREKAVGLPDSPIDWNAAVRTGQRLAPHGPRVTAAQARAAVSDLHRLAGTAELRVRETTGLGLDLPVAAAEVVDRAGWIAATAEGMAALTAPLAGRLPPLKAGRSVAGSQVGLLLGYLSGRVLGQFDPLGGDAGRLLLVAPNVIKVERELDAEPGDFRLWVCLHESTHRLQFTAVPWLTDHFRGLIGSYAEVATTDPSEMLRRAVAAVRGGRSRAEDGESWIQRIQTPEQRTVFDALLALMTLLEGHADHVMDAVGPAVVPSVASIRAAFSERRRKGRGPLDRLVRSLLGLDTKMAQYVRGAAFVRAVVARVGMEGFNRLWTSPDTLPTLAEIAQPADWVRRVHG